MSRVGVLALQGGFAAHARALRSLGCHVSEVRRPADLGGLAGLVLPGGESTTLLRLLEDAPWHDAVRRFHSDGGALLGTCAGAILLAREVRPAQRSFGLLDACAARNAYGRQAQSFEATVTVEGADLPAVFIRAPRLESLGSTVEVLGRHGDQPVVVRQGRIMAATFHPELTSDTSLHALWLRTCVAERPAARGAA